MQCTLALTSLAALAVTARGGAGELWIDFYLGLVILNALVQAGQYLYELRVCRVPVVRHFLNSILFQTQISKLLCENEG